MGTHRFHVVRPTDLLVAVFELDGFDLVSISGRLEFVRSPGGSDARLVVHLPPQSVAEEVVRPEQAALLDLVHPSPALGALRSGSSRLAFRVPPSISRLQFTLASLLDWGSLEPLSAADDREPLEPRPPPPGTTAIEVPWRLIMTSCGGTRWIPSLEPGSAGDNSVVALWHARLAADGGALQVRFAWSPDVPGPASPSPPFDTTLSAATRRDLVRITADFGLLDERHFGPLDEEDLRQLEGLQSQVAVPVPVRRLVLGALGADLAVNVAFAHPDLGRLASKHRDAAAGPLPPPFFSLRHWSHEVSSGRDHHVQTITAGHLYPFGHRAAVVERVDREFRDNPRTAALTRHVSLLLLETERRYESRAWPFVSVSVAAPVGEVFEPQPVAGEPLLFWLPIVAKDHAGAFHDMRVPVGVVRDNEPGDLPAIASAYGIRDIETAGRTIAFVPQEFTPQDQRGSALLATQALQIAGPSAGTALADILPSMASAVVRLQALESLSPGAPKLARIAWDADYAERGFSLGDTTRHFARIVSDDAALPTLRLDASRFGGLAAPAVPLRALSLARGLGVGQLDPTALVRSIGGKLLGFIDLATLVDMQSVKDEFARLPSSGPVAARPEVKLIEQTAGARELRLDWRLPLKGGKAGGELGLQAVIPIGVNPPKPQTMDGTLRNFAVEFPGFARLVFKQLHFRAESGRTPTIDQVQLALEFIGDLAFLEAVAKELAKAMPGTPGGVRVSASPKGLSAGITLALPRVAMGQFALVNLALAATIELRFDEPAELRFSLSSRRDPFLVSYSAFGGGGWFNLVVDVEGPRQLEAAIEMGAVVEVDFGIVRASAHVLVGIYFSLERDGSSRLGGLVRVHGAVELFQLITVSVDVTLLLTYSAGIATGRAELTICVQVLAFSRSVTFSVERSFDTRLLAPGDVIALGLGAPGESPRRAPVAEPVPVRLEEWARYYDAFA